MATEAQRRIARENGRKGGRPKGSVCQKTLEKQAARELVRALVNAELEPLVRAQIANAKGIKFLVVREKATGKFVRVSQSLASQKLKKGEEIIEVWEKDPDKAAFAELMNRALDKAAEQPIPITGDFDVTLKWED